ncbi:MAG: diguanylate cyclase [Desulfotalea sp.]
MTISQKVLLIMSLLVVILMSAAVLVQKKMILPTFTEIELQQAKTNIDRIEALYYEVVSELDRSAFDWSSWDDIYRFIQDRNKTFIDSNLGPETFGNIQINFLYILDLDGNLVWGEVYDLTQNEPAIITTDKFVKQSLLLLNSSIEKIDSSLTDELQFSKGIFVQDNVPVLFSARPILTSHKKGPIKGYLVLGKLLTDELLDVFQERIKIKFNLDVSEYPHLLNKNVPKVKYQINNLTDTSFEISREYFLGNNEDMIRISTIFPRDITQQGLNSIKYALGTHFFVGLFGIVVVWILLKITILAPISTLTKQMLKISRNKDYTLRFNIERGDEIGAMAKEFNYMLSIIERNNMDLERLTMTDSLTGIANRLCFTGKLKSDWSTQQRAKRPLAILMIDIDFFKSFNDYYGHPAGDQCLKQVADILCSCVRRSSDLVARYGGEEFILIMPGIDISSAIEVADNVQTVIIENQIEHLKSEISNILTVSIGIASVVPSDESTIESLIKQADSALYDAKKNGRNRFEVAREDDKTTCYLGCAQRW